MADYISKQRAKDLMGCCLASAKAEYKSAKDEFTKARFEDYISTIQAMIDVVGSVEAADVQPIQWISCKDNMPDTLERGLSTMYSDCCLVCDAFGWVGMAYYITDGQKSWWEFADAQNKNKIDWTEVTHWMPLPEPPKDGEQNG